MNFGNLLIPTGAALAPMAGATDTAMRVLCAKHRAAYTVSEMVSAKALCMGDKKSPRLIRGAGGTAPFGVQLFGACPQDFETAIKLIDDMGMRYDFLDINMGCPAPKITSSGAGSALLKNPLLCEKIAAACVKAAKTPVTVKIRIGWDLENLTGLEVAKRCESVGVAAVAIHARTRAEMYNPGVHLDEISKAAAALSIPVIANGDITSAKAALDVIQATACSGVMVGRGAMGNPWIFEEIAAALCGEEAPSPPSLEKRLATMREHIAAMCNEKGEHIAMNEARSHAAWYMHGLRKAANLRRECCGLVRFSDLDGIIELARKVNTANEPF